MEMPFLAKIVIGVLRKASSVAPATLRIQIDDSIKSS